MFMAIQELQQGDANGLFKINLTGLTATFVLFGPSTKGRPTMMGQSLQIQTPIGELMQHSYFARYLGHFCYSDRSWSTPPTVIA
jgi:hypothetical protein